MAIRKSTIILLTVTSLTLGGIASFIAMDATGIISINSKDNELILKVNDVEEEYTGEEIKANSYSIINGKELNEGETLEATYYGSQTEVGTNVSTMKAVIKKDGVDVTSKYNITYKTGEIKVKKRELQVSYIDEITYGASTIDDYSLIKGSLLDNHILKGVIDKNIQYPGYNLHFPIIGIVYDESGHDVTNNYSIIQQTSYITVHPNDSNKKSYDLSFNSYQTTYKEGMSISSDDVKDLVSAKPGSLYEGDYLDLDNTSIYFLKEGEDTAGDTITEAGFYKVYLGSCNIKHHDGTDSSDYNSLVEGNYPVIGTINVLQKEVIATFDNVVAEYLEGKQEYKSTVTFIDNKGNPVFDSEKYTYTFEEIPKRGISYQFGTLSDVKELLEEEVSEELSLDNYKFNIVQGTYTCPIQ